MEGLFKHFVSTIVYDFIANTLCYYENGKDDNVPFYYSRGFLILLSLSLKIMMEILNDFLWVGNIVTFISSIL